MRNRITENEYQNLLYYFEPEELKKRFTIVSMETLALQIKQGLESNMPVQKLADIMGFPYALIRHQVDKYREDIQIKKREKFSVTKAEMVDIIKKMKGRKTKIRLCYALGEPQNIIVPYSTVDRLLREYDLLNALREPRSL